MDTKYLLRADAGRRRGEAKISLRVILARRFRKPYKISASARFYAAPCRRGPIRVSPTRPIRDRAVTVRDAARDAAGGCRPILE
ncbi:hypothetical protein EVAR_36750_1 [Eumeta japonica]|uniref:Uncharacterized protein n=1 Tax=Eumeta variegata TaxID=151549 RepID=A0A4C1X1P9_EUMVA|nr:hypothetical protein EVAR_36750_1 [Eumeta japonica]